MRHARHFASLTPRAELIAVYSPVQAELDAAAKEFPDVHTYTDYDQMLFEEETLQAVIVASTTIAHAEQAIKAIELGLHSESVVDAYKTSLESHPNQKVICGFSRRFDASYRDAHKRIVDGSIGTPSVFRSQTCDKLSPIDFLVKDAETSCGIFLDCSIHDIDLALWFFGEESKLKSVTAVGITAVQPGLRKRHDRDNALGIIEFYGGKMVQLYCSRMMASDQEYCTEIFGTEGKIAIDTQPQLNLVNLYEPGGIRREIPADFYERFKEAFVTEANEFTASCLDNTPAPLQLDSAVKAVAIACALQESLITGKKIEFDENGRRLEGSKL
ncbi:hypothetical protein N7523_009037 [Penicillium sp. IBT 18751x]|nr:hypothetical protein N7523_009037 [Penicillium sp. IBT 18751x]